MSHYNHRWLGDAEEQRPLHQPYPQHAPAHHAGGPGSYPPAGPVPFYTAENTDYPRPPSVLPHLQPAVTSSISPAPSAMPPAPAAPGVVSTTPYARNPDDLFRTNATTTTATAGYQHYPQQPPPRLAPRYAAGEGNERARQTRLRNERAISQQRTIRRKRFPFFLILATLAQCVMMGVEIWKNGGFESLSVNPFFGPSAETLIELGAKDVPRIVKDYEVWRFFSPIFLHAGLLHLVFNLLFQLQCLMIERQMGCLRVGFVYLVAGFGGNLASSLFLPQLISVGASGALFGMVGMLFVVIIRNWSLVLSPCRNLFMLCITVAISLFIGLLPNVDNFAHVGGLLTGLVASIVVVPSLEEGARAGPCRLFVASLSLLVLVVALGLGVYALFEDVPLREWCGFCSFINCVDFGQGWCKDLDLHT